MSGIPPTGGATDAEIAAALAVLLAVRTAVEHPDAAGSGDDRAAGTAWRRAIGPRPGSWSVGGWRGPARPRSWS